MSNISLIGYRGTGKSTIAAILATKMQRQIIVIDEAIVKTAGKPIPQIIEKSGWGFFRNLESLELAKALAHDNVIIDCGGGIILSEENRKILKYGSTVVLLTAEISTIADRIGGDDNRPSLTGKGLVEEIEEVLTIRKPLYAMTANKKFPTDHDSPEEVAQKIIDALSL